MDNERAKRRKRIKNQILQNRWDVVIDHFGTGTSPLQVNMSRRQHVDMILRTPIPDADLRKFGRDLMAGREETSKRLTEYLKGKGRLTELNDVVVFEEAYKKGRALADYKARLLKSRNGTLVEGDDDNDDVEEEDEEDNGEEEVESAEKEVGKGDEESENEWKDGDDDGRKEAVSDWTDIVASAAKKVDWKKLKNKKATYDKLAKLHHCLRSTDDICEMGIAFSPGTQTCETCFHACKEKMACLSLPHNEESRRKWETIFSLSPDSIVEGYRKLTGVSIDKLGFGHEDLAFWDSEMVSSICLFIMHELHPLDVDFWFYNEKIHTDANNKSYEYWRNDLNPGARYLIVIVLQNISNEHFSHYVFDLANGYCDVLDPTPDPAEPPHVKIVYEILMRFGLVPVSGDFTTDMLITTDVGTRVSKFQREGVNFFLPYKVRINHKGGSLLIQEQGWTCGPVTIVKLVETLFRLHVEFDVKFLGPRAKLRIDHDGWNTLGSAVADLPLLHGAPFDAWNPKKNGLTDKDVLAYVNKTLLTSFLDGMAFKELTQESNFVAPERPHILWWGPKIVPKKDKVFIAGIRKDKDNKYMADLHQVFQERMTIRMKRAWYIPPAVSTPPELPRPIKEKTKKKK